MKKTFALLLMLVLALGVSVQAATLPAGYTEVEYVQSTGRGYIDTGFVPADASTSIAYEIDFCYDIANFGDNNKIMLGVGVDSKRPGNIIAGMNTSSFNSLTAICFGSQAPGSAASKYANTLDRVELDVSMDLVNNTYTVKKDGAVVGTENTTITGEVDSAYSLYLFASHNASGPAYYAPGKVYSLKMYVDEELVRDFVPCYRESDDVAGMYDLVEDEFYCCEAATDALTYPGQEGELVEGDTAVVINANTGEIYYGKDIDLEHGMASTTKVMTCILTIENMALTDRTLVANEFDCDTSGSMMHLEVGEELLIYDVLRGLMLPSGNDAAKLLARTVGTKLGTGYDTFIEMMNQKAVEIGMMNTHYNSPIGGEYTTVVDYARLGHYCMQNPIFRDVVATVDYTIQADPAHGVKQHILRNTNYLLPGTFVGELPTGEEFGDVYEYEGITGIKTGTTSSAGACLLSTVTREINGEQVDLVAVILGTNGNESVRNRFTESIKMYDLGFKLVEEQAYEVTVDGNKLIAKNPVTGYTMTAIISAPDVALTGEKVEPATVETTNSDNRYWEPFWDITYTNNDKVGTATASITFGGKTASVDFEIVEPTVTLTENTTVSNLVVPAGQTIDLNGFTLSVENGLVVNEGGKIMGGELKVAKAAVVSLGSNGGYVPVWFAEQDGADCYGLYPTDIKAGKTVVSTDAGTTYSFGYKMTEANGTNPYSGAVAAGDKIKFGVQLDLGEAKATYNFSADSVAKMNGINAAASSDEFFKVNLKLAGSNNPLTRVRVAPVIKVDALGFAYVGEATGETDGEYVARIGNNTWYYTIEDAIAAAEKEAAETGKAVDVKLIHDIEFKRPVTIKMNGMVRFETAADAQVTISGPVTFDGQGIAAKCALFYFNGDCGEITLDGVTIRNYNNIGEGSINSYGSAIVATASTVTLKDVTIKDCESASRGAAFYGYNYASLVAENCSFENLTGGDSYGGAISIVNAKIVDLDGCEFTNCAITPYAEPPLYASCPAICARPCIDSMFCAVLIFNSSAVCEIYVNISSAIFEITTNNCPKGDAGVKTLAACSYFTTRYSTAC
ncbi:MAG: D-alanyl-D-alanine carboxypeptidase [Oscillospiraceae bacterium]|nr:D-alanyl-D-alanine carboxypeptidase [Oscillospiraceae bacterium]